MSLKNKIIIVTGGSGLLGRAMLKDFAEQGATTINFDLTESTAVDGQDFIQCDITKQESVDAALRKVMEAYGRIDGLVNNAYPRTKDWGTAFEDVPYSSWQQNVEMQLNTAFYLCQQTLLVMKEQGNGSIVNIASIYGAVGNDFTIYENTPINPPAAYSAIKGGLINFTRYLASFYGQHGIRVNALSPGGIFDHQPDAFVSAYEKKVPLKRMGTPEDIAPVARFLLSDDAAYVTGQNWLVDGGWTAI